MLRFKAGSKLGENFYVRQDGTRSYFFTDGKITGLCLHLCLLDCVITVLLVGMGMAILSTHAKLSDTCPLHRHSPWLRWAHKPPLVMVSSWPGLTDRLACHVDTLPELTGKGGPTQGLLHFVQSKIKEIGQYIALWLLSQVTKNIFL